MKNVDKILKKYLTKDDYKKYNLGGEFDEKGNPKITGMQAAQGGVAIAGLATPLVAQQDEVAGGVLGGAVSGASAGAMFGPIGMGVGAGVGALVGGIQADQAKNEREKREREYQDALNKQNYNLAVLRGKQTPVNGNQTYSLTERKEGGKLSALSSNTMLATGATHEEGGIKLPQLGAEVEDKETLKMTKDGGTYVMSDTLINPKSGNTFAKDDMNLSKLKGKLEKSTSRFKENGLSLLKNKEQKLVDIHEQVRQNKGLETADNTQIAKDGGKFTNTRIAYATKDNSIFPDGQPRYTQIGLDVGDRTFTPNKQYSITDPKVEGKFMDNVDNTELMIDDTTKQKNKFNTSNLANLTPYIDNITGAIYNNERSKEKIPNLQSLTYLNPKLVNYSQAIKDTRDTTTSFNRGVDSTNVNQGNANIMKAFALGEQQKGIARISQEETNVNAGISNDFAGKNKEIEKYNNEGILNNSLRQLGARDDIRREGQQNVVSVVGKLQQQRRDAKLEDLYANQNEIDLANAKPETLDYLKSKNLFKKKDGGTLKSLSY